MVEAYRGRVWLALGYESWDDWKAGELAGVELPRDVIPALRAEGRDLASTSASFEFPAETSGLRGVVDFIGGARLVREMFKDG